MVDRSILSLRSWQTFAAAVVAVAALVAGPFLIGAWHNRVDAAGGGAASFSGLGFFPSYYDDVFYGSVGVTRHASNAYSLLRAVECPTARR